MCSIDPPGSEWPDMAWKSSGCTCNYIGGASYLSCRDKTFVFLGWQGDSVAGAAPQSCPCTVRFATSCLAPLTFAPTRRPRLRSAAYQMSGTREVESFLEEIGLESCVQAVVSTATESSRLQKTAALDLGSAAHSYHMGLLPTGAMPRSTTASTPRWRRCEVPRTRSSLIRGFGRCTRS